MIKEIRDSRFKTIDMNKIDANSKKQRLAFSKPHTLTRKQGIKQNINQIISRTTPRQITLTQFSNRDSGKIISSPYLIKSKPISHLDTLINEAKAQLQKLSYREKLTQICHLIKSVKQLCKTYGFFTPTQAMLQFHYDEPLKISIWIHPNVRSKKPLHPIKKQTQFQCQLDCVAQLKVIIKNLFPNVDIGAGKTLSNLIAHLDVAQAELDNKNRKATNLIRKQSNKTSEQSPTNKQSGNIKQNILMFSTKTVPTIARYRTEQDTIEQEINRFKFRIDQRNKQTTSTLLDSIRSGNSLKEKLKFQSGSPTKLQPNSPAKIEPNSPTKILSTNPIKQQQNKQFLIKNTNQQKKDVVQTQEKNDSPTKNPQVAQKSLIQKLNLVDDEKLPKQKSSQLFNSQMKQSKLKQSNRLYMKTSQHGKRLMSMSIEIQSQINNLFGSTDDMLHTLYSKNNEIKALKSSVLSKVAEQFQDLF